MSTQTVSQRSVSARARIIEIEKDHADVDFHTVNHYWKHEGLKYKDAMHAEELERELDRLQALAAAGLLDAQEEEQIDSLRQKLERFVSAATCHKEKQHAQKQVERAEAPLIEVQRTSNVVTVCADSERRMKALLHLTTPAGFDPAFSVDQHATYEWELVFHSITEASRFEQLCADASRLATA